MSQLVSPANPLAYFRAGMNPYLLYMTLMERADRFRSGTKIWIRCDYRDEVVLERLVPEYNFVCKCSNAEKALQDVIFAKYNKDVQPAGNSTAPLQVWFGFKPYRLISFNEKEQSIKINVWYRSMWWDRAVTWNPADHSNISRIFVPASSVWLPPVALLNSLKSGIIPNFKKNDDDQETLVIIRHDGNFKHYSPLILDSSCPFKLNNFPFDTQECFLYFGFWSYSKEHIELMVDYDQSRPDSFEPVTFGEWQLHQYNAGMVEQNNKTLQEANTSLPLHSKLGFAQPTLKFSLVLKRYARQYIVTQFVPCFVNAMLCVLVFLLPADAGERLGVGINVILIMWVNYLRVLDSFPQSEEPPIFCGFYFIMMFECVCALAATNILLYLYHMNAAMDIPQWVQVYILDYLARPLMLKESIQNRLRFIERFRSDALQFRSRFGGKSYHKITVGLNFFVERSLKKFEEFWFQEEWRLVALVLEKFFTYLLVFSIILSFVVFWLML